MEQKENLSKASKVSSSSNSKSNKSSNSSHITNCTYACFTQQTVDDLTKGLGNMFITNNRALMMQKVAEWCLVGREDTNYNNSTTFKEAWYHEDKNKRKK